jgi:hypothetical protein
LAVAACAVAFTSVAMATHQVPSPTANKTIHISVVPNFKQCGTGANPSDGQHSPPLGVPACLPPLPGSSVAFAGPNFTGSADITVRPDSSDVDLVGTSTDVRSGSVSGPPFSGSVGSTSRIRFSDHYNCAGLGCTGPYTSSGTGTDTDFGPVPVTCTSGTCTVNTSANAVLAGSVVPGKQAVVQVFRVRINDGFPSGNLMAQQGIYIP